MYVRTHPNLIMASAILNSAGGMGEDGLATPEDGGAGERAEVGYSTGQKTQVKDKHINLRVRDSINLRVRRPV